MQHDDDIKTAANVLHFSSSFFLIQLCYLIILSKSQVTENDFVVISVKTTSDSASHASAC